ncbi:S1 RNA-binding domain-containing protein [Candidatus Woesearchaeota archaeon]|nr:S1 RNA-binding domain-containing protein [Candidatus Woesearchaeota archaeon]
MLIKKDKFPEVDELVIATVTKVNPNSVFTTMDEYEGKTALIHISEISPGRIRNIRDYVVEGKKIICKVLKVDVHKGHVDLSLRRVTEIQKRNKSDELKQEQKAEQLFNFFVKENKIGKKVQNDFIKKINKEYSAVYDFYTDVVEENITVSEILDEKGFSQEFEDFIKDKIKPEEVEIIGTMKITSFEPDGVEIIKKVIKKNQDELTNISYLGSGNYSIKIKSKEFKEAEKILKEKIENIEKAIEKSKGIFEFERKE